MTRTLGVAGGLVLAAVLYVSVQFIGVSPKAVAVFPAGASTNVPAAATTPDAALDPIENLAAWPVAAGR